MANPCCMPLKVGIKIICHLSMALSLAVGLMGVRVISISLEVTTNPTFQQQHLSTLQFQNEKRNEILWRSNSIPMMKAPYEELIYPLGDEFNSDGLSSPFSNSHPLFKYAKSMLVSGLLSISAASFQFLSSCLFLFFINWEGKSPSQIYVAVQCAILFCLATSLVHFLCGHSSVPAFAIEEKVFLALLSTDTILSIYFLWIVMAFI